LGKAEIVKKWKPDLKALGFVYRDIIFQLKETTNKPAPALYNFASKKLTLRNVHGSYHSLNQESLRARF